MSGALRIDLRPSRLLSAALVVVHGLALYAAWISVPGWPRVLAAGVILTSLADSLARALLLRRRSVVSLELHEDGRASWRERRGEVGEGKVGRSHFVSPCLVVVGLVPAGRGPRRVIFLADSAAPDDLRQLRVWLRWPRSPDRQKAE